MTVELSQKQVKEIKLIQKFIIAEFEKIDKDELTNQDRADWRRANEIITALVRAEKAHKQSNKKGTKCNDTK